MLDNTKLLSTGEFCKLCNTTKDTLFHYEKLGLIFPHHRNENGYRYYSYSQLSTFFTIKLFKEMNIPLQEVKKYLSNKNHNDYILMLKHQEKIIEEHINNLQDIKSYINHKIKFAEISYNTIPGKVINKQLDSEKIVATKEIIFKDVASLYNEINNFIKYCKENSLNVTYDIGSITSIEEITKDQDSHCFQLFTKLLDSSKLNDELITVKPSGKYLIAYHKGNYYNIRETYHLIIDHALNKGITLIDPFYEIAVIDEISSPNDLNLLIEISIRIA
ncbi:MerR family transcriptional regulator [Alkaliphilus pronyensis]|uniref:MerR family transcriptional regulator n=1 Tax=Alkaliphilus pronyensis TaxID=1482732 RepID=A0A6I0F8X3_9FIRM|nr:MerR family transcriptional regulator [Alkaliphilus pronyensis]KAB3532136.1 MerR family transcriptional regulator [Alkaliphilus pronyensis]